jgi:pimeloyl-ACP methyl ester carboxylesterase
VATGRTGRTTRRITSLDGVVLSVTTSGAGPDVLLVHGSGLTGSSWAYVAKHLATDHTVHVMDRRGGGSSGDAGGIYSVELEAHDVRAVVESIGADNSAHVHLVGHSYGGLIALLAAPRTGTVGGPTVYEPPCPFPVNPADGPPTGCDATTSWWRREIAMRQLSSS